MRLFDAVSFVRARKAQSTANLATGDIGSLVSMVSALQVQLGDTMNTLGALELSHAALRSEHDALLLAHNALQSAYATHTHGYADVDNTGTTINKTTGTPA